MINGKFFAGLPPKMMDRGNGPNRQQSKFYWPDESDAEPASESKLKRRNRNTPQTLIASKKIQSNNEIEPKELFKKHLTSKIEFYDMIDEKDLEKSPLLKDRQDNTGETGERSSKTKFYDYSDNYDSKDDKNSKKYMEKNAKNSPKTVEKRIKFVHNVPIEKGAFVSKGILRNNDSRLKENSVQVQSRKNSMRKKSLSKSVENLTSPSRDFSDDEDDCIKVIENDVKTIAINDQKIKEKKIREEVDKQGSYWNLKVDKVQNFGVSLYENGWDSLEQIDENFYRKTGKNEPFVLHHKLSSGDESLQVHSDLKSKFEETPEDNFSSTSRHRIEDSKALNNDNWHKAENHVKNQNSSMQSQNNFSKPVQTSLDHPLGNRAQRHLVSNIRFGNDIEASTEQAQKTARGSAVMRVSVGLPD